MIDRITVIEGDITQQADVDAIVSGLPVTLKILGGINKAILQAAGPELDNLILEHIFKPKVGNVFILPGLNLPARQLLFVITPPWQDTGFNREDGDLIHCYKAVIDAACGKGMGRIACAPIATGQDAVFPVERGARLALTCVMNRIKDPLQEVRFVCGQRDLYEAFAERLDKAG